MLNNLIESIQEISAEDYHLALEAGFYIGLASAVYLLCFGRKLGISVLVSEVVENPLSEISRKKITIITGIIFISALIKTLYYQHIIDLDPFDSAEYTNKTDAFKLILSGLIFGIGTEIAKTS